jgi:hypothetical protein
MRYVAICEKGSHIQDMVEDRRKPGGRGWAVLADPEGNEFCVPQQGRRRILITVGASPGFYRRRFPAITTKPARPGRQPNGGQ